MTIQKKDLHHIFPELSNTKLKLIVYHLTKKNSSEFTRWQSFCKKERSSPYKEIADKAFFVSDPSSTKKTTEASKSDLDSFLSSIKPLREKNKLKLFTLTIPKKTAQQKMVSEEAAISPSLFDEPTFYTENMPEKHITRLHGDKWQGWIDFFITSNNEIILTPTSYLVKTFFGQESSSIDLECYLNLATLSWGTLVKTAGKLRIETDSQGNKRFILAAESDYWEVDQDKMIPIVLQVFYQQGFYLSKENVFFLNKREAIPLDINESVPEKFLTPVDHYLATPGIYTEVSEEKYPLATKIAKRTDPVVAAKLSALFLAIDDAVLNSKNTSAIQQLFLSPFISTEGRPQNNRLIVLKENIGKFLASLTFEITDTAPLTETNIDSALPSSSVTTAAIQLPEARKKPIQWLEKIFDDVQSIQNNHDIDLNFVCEEVLSLQFYYEETKRQYEEAQCQENEEKQQQLIDEINNTKAIFRHFSGDVARYSRREVSSSITFNRAPITRFLSFYEQDPWQTCINLLRDYTKNGSRLMRVLTGAWRRHYVPEVQQFLDDYDNGRIIKDGSINSIYQKIFSGQSLSELINDLDRKNSTCIARLRFCATLTGEMSDSQSTNKLFGFENLEDKQVAAMEQEEDPISANDEELTKETKHSETLISSATSDTLCFQQVSNVQGPTSDPVTNSKEPERKTSVSDSSSSSVIPLKPEPTQLETEKTESTELNGEESKSNKSNVRFTTPPSSLPAETEQQALEQETLKQEDKKPVEAQLSSVEEAAQLKDTVDGKSKDIKESSLSSTRSSYGESSTTFFSPPAAQDSQVSSPSGSVAPSQKTLDEIPEDTREESPRPAF